MTFHSPCFQKIYYLVADKYKNNFKSYLTYYLSSLTLQYYSVYLCICTCIFKFSIFYIHILIPIDKIANNYREIFTDNLFLTLIKDVLTSSTSSVLVAILFARDHALSSERSLYEIRAGWRYHRNIFEFKSS